MDLSLLTAGLQSINVMKTLAEGLVSVRDEAKLLETKFALLGQLISVQQAMLTLQAAHADVLQEKQALLKEKDEAEKRAERLADEAKERQRHAPIDLGGGIFVVAAKSAEDGRHGPPYYCQACYAQDKKIALQRAGGGENGTSYSCPISRAHNIWVPRGGSWRSASAEND